MIIVGIDPGFASLGWSIVKVSRDKNEYQFKLIDAGVISTKKASKRQKMLASDDLILRMRKIRSKLLALDYRAPSSKKGRGAVIGGGVDRISALNACAYVASESMSWGFQGVRAHRQLGMAWGIITCVLDEVRRPLISVEPMVMKDYVTGDPKAKKTDVEEALVDREGFESLRTILDSYPKNKREHICDAIGVAMASIETDASRFFSARL